MKSTCLLLFSLVSMACLSQPKEFPGDWVGNWKGELQWFRAADTVPRKVMMELRIHPIDSSGTYTWQIIYGSETADNRPYQLIAKDRAKGHWVIDEKNGIILDQFWIANRFCGAFTVQNSTIVNNYRIENGQLIAEFYSLSAKPLATTGDGTEDSPHVDSYGMKSYQKAILRRQ